VWYGVPAHASQALEEAVRDALPHLFATAPNLLYQLVTMVSPRQLLARGVPVHRLVHEEGSFVITFPNAYHSGFNTGAHIVRCVIGRTLLADRQSNGAVLPPQHAGKASCWTA
jgi:histone demethylase JARID1